MGKTWVMLNEHINNHNKTIAMSSLLYQTYTPTVIYKHKTKIGPSYKRHVVHPRSQTLQGQSVAKTEIILLTVLNLVK